MLLLRPRTVAAKQWFITNIHFNGPPCQIARDYRSDLCRAESPRVWGLYILDVQCRIWWQDYNGLIVNILRSMYNKRYN